MQMGVIGFDKLDEIEEINLIEIDIPDGIGEEIKKEIKRISFEIAKESRGVFLIGIVKWKIYL